MSGKVFRDFLCIHYMDNLDNKKSQKNPLFFCEKCKYITNNKKDYSKHLLTRKHILDTNGYNEDNTKIPAWKCSCGKMYKYKPGLYKHKKICPNLSQEHNNEINSLQNNIVMEMVKQNQSYIFNNQEFKEIIIEQNKYIQEQQKHNEELHKKILDIAKEGKIIKTSGHSDHHPPIQLPMFTSFFELDTLFGL